MFDYARVTAIQDYLATRFGDGFVRCALGQLERWGDAHTFDIESDGHSYRLTVAHAFIDRLVGDMADYFDGAGLPRLLREAGPAGVQVTAGRVAAPRSANRRAEHTARTRRAVVAYGARATSYRDAWR